MPPEALDRDQERPAPLRPRSEDGYFGNEAKQHRPYGYFGSLPGHGFFSGTAAAVSVSGRPTSERAWEKFVRLRDEWKSEKTHTSSVEARILHPAYLRIIGMGWEAVSLILTELDEQRLDHWFPALYAITEANPVPAQDAGQMRKMAEAWVRWGKQNGHYQ